jgi:hypothetical protein
MNAKSLAQLSTEDLHTLYTLRAQELNLIMAEGAKRKAAAEQVAHTVATKTAPEFLPLGGHVTENGKPWQAASPEDFAIEHAAPVAATPLHPVTEDGMYVLGGTIYKIQWNLAHTNLYAKELVIHEGANATFEYAAGMIKNLHAEDKMTLEQAKEYGHLYGVCCKCGATLTDEKSIEAGIGPICAGKGW